MGKRIRWAAVARTTLRNFLAIFGARESAAIIALPARGSRAAPKRPPGTAAASAKVINFDPALRGPSETSRASVFAAIGAARRRHHGQSSLLPPYKIAKK
jgi:hypothetical protein